MALFSRALVLVPGLLANPAQSNAGIGADLDAGGLGGGDGLLDALHQVLGVANQHVRRLQILFCPLNKVYNVLQ